MNAASAVRPPSKAEDRRFAGLRRRAARAPLIRRVGRRYGLTRKAVGRPPRPPPLVVRRDVGRARPRSQLSVAALVVVAKPFKTVVRPRPRRRVRLVCAVAAEAASLQAEEVSKRLFKAGRVSLFLPRAYGVKAVVGKSLPELSSAPRVEGGAKGLGASVARRRYVPAVLAAPVSTV